jgi:hypothetical protein
VLAEVLHVYGHRFINPDSPNVILSEYLVRNAGGGRALAADAA